MFQQAISKEEILYQSFQILRFNLQPFFLLSLIINFPINLVTAMMISANSFATSDSSQFFVTFFFSIFKNSLLIGALLYGIFRFLREEPYTIRDSFQIAMGKLTQLSLAATLLTAIILSGSILILPGIIFSILFFVVIPVVVIENTNIPEALSRSIQLTRGSRWTIFFVMLIIGLPALGVARLIEMIIAGIAVKSVLIDAIVRSLFEGVVGVFQAIVTVVGYYLLRMKADDTTLEHILGISTDQ